MQKISLLWPLQFQPVLMQPQLGRTRPLTYKPVATGPFPVFSSARPTEDLEVEPVFEDSTRLRGTRHSLNIWSLPFCISLHLALRMTNNQKVVIKITDMCDDMKQDALQCATQAFENHTVDAERAEAIKKKFDDKYSPTWHCIVGREFGSYVTHKSRHLIHFKVGHVAIQLFKSG